MRERTRLMVEGGASGRGGSMKPLHGLARPGIPRRVAGGRAGALRGCEGARLASDTSAAARRDAAPDMTHGHSGVDPYQWERARGRWSFGPWRTLTQ